METSWKGKFLFDIIEMFTTNYSKIIDKIESIDPIEYGRTRNYLSGAVTYLSPYIARGVISTRQVMQSFISRGFKLYEIESMVKELAWRDYFQRVHQSLGNEIYTDIKNQQSKVISNKIPTCLINGNTGIEGIDYAIESLYKTGYVHNHFRMYTAMLATNIAQTHWSECSKWYYCHLLDADIASNTLSWQWVCGAFSHKKYYANQENIDKYFGKNQSNTFLDTSYEMLAEMSAPNIFHDRIEDLNLATNLPSNTELKIDYRLPTLIYNFYNLDPNWHENKEANRILLLEPSIFDKHPVSEKTLDFMLVLVKNISNIQIFVGEFSELKQHLENSEIYFKEHPFNYNYSGIEESRDWMCAEITGYFLSFFSYWKRIEPILKSQFRR